MSFLANNQNGPQTLQDGAGSLLQSGEGDWLKEARKAFSGPFPQDVTKPTQQRWNQ